MMDPERIRELIGKTVLIGVTYLDGEDQLLERRQWFGEILRISPEEGIVIRLAGENEECRLPPDLTGIRKAEPGQYRLRSTGERVTNPDYMATLICVESGKTLPKNSRFFDSTTRASDPGGIRLSIERLHRLNPDLCEPKGVFRLIRRLSPSQMRKIDRIKEHLRLGDSRAALVVSTAPLLVAAYTDELDCIALLAFPDDFTQAYELTLHSRLLTVNVYHRGVTPYPDLRYGSYAYHRYCNFEPLIADFLTDDAERVDRRKREILESEWRRTSELAQAYLEEHGMRSRDGRPTLSGIPAWR